jgi:hypothetical protein
MYEQSLSLTALFTMKAHSNKDISGPIQTAFPCPSRHCYQLEWMGVGPPPTLPPPYASIIVESQIDPIHLYYIEFWPYWIWRKCVAINLNGWGSANPIRSPIHNDAPELPSPTPFLYSYHIIRHCVISSFIPCHCFPPFVYERTGGVVKVPITSC